MIDGHHALTDKEKQALRLLTSGYDAKSMAAHLGLSVHTINERLRDARRKMATSSSREAARLLRERESVTPEKAADKDLGAAADGIAAAQPVHQPGDQMVWRRPGWILGGAAMTFVPVAFALVAFALAALSAPEAATPTAPLAAAAEHASVTAARSFLALVDADDWDASWKTTGQSFKALNTPQVWAKASASVRKTVGACQRRELVSTEYVPAPPNGYHVVKFRASYANQPIATETLSLIWENNGWQVVGVTID